MTNLFGNSKMKSHKVDIQSELRTKREGFGPWEAQAEWNEVGNSNILATLEVVRDELVKIDYDVMNYMNNTVHYIEDIVSAAVHPIATMWKTDVGKIIICMIIFLLGLFFTSLLVKFVSLVRIVVRGVYWFLKKSFTTVYNLTIRPLFKLSCCMSLCALKPFRCLRNYYIRRRVLADDINRIRVIDNEAEDFGLSAPLYSDVFTDERGVFLKDNLGKRIYLKPDSRASDLSLLRTFSPSVGESEGQIVKEAVTARSKLYKVDKLPDFQGEFTVDGIHIGFFSRIKYKGKDCILTCYHVLEYNMAGMVCLKKGDVSVELASIRVRIVSCSPTKAFDYIIMECPTALFSVLKLKVGELATRVQSREVVQIYQLYEGKPCVSQGTISISDVKHWHVEYVASTITGTSGAPILDVKRRIVGVHLETDTSRRVNLGVIPPVFRSQTFKESAQKNTITENEPELEEYGIPEEEIDVEEQERDIDNYIMENLIYELKNQEDYQLGGGSDWATQMDEFEHKMFEDDRREWYNYHHQRDFKVFVAGDASGGHVNHRIKGMLYRKESPWTCKRCLTVQRRGYNCVNCKLVLVPLSKDDLSEIPKRDAIIEKHMNDFIPPEMVDNVMKYVEGESFAAKVALQVAALISRKEALLNVSHQSSQSDVHKCDMLECELDKQYPTMSAKDKSGIFPDLPTNIRVKIEKKLAQSIATGNENKNLGISTFPRDDVHLTSKKHHFSATKSLKEGGVCFDTHHDSIVPLKLVKESVVINKDDLKDSSTFSHNVAFTDNEDNLSHNDNKVPDKTLIFKEAGTQTKRKNGLSVSCTQTERLNGTRSFCTQTDSDGVRSFQTQTETTKMNIIRSPPIQDGGVVKESSIVSIFPPTAFRDVKVKEIVKEVLVTPIVAPKETYEELQNATVPLNLQAPVSTGEQTTTGLKKKRASRANRSKLARALVDLTELDARLKALFGSVSAE